MHRGSCAGELLAVPGGYLGVRGRVWGVCGGGPRPGEGREGAGEARGAARVSVLIGALGRPWRACEGGRSRESVKGLRCGGRGRRLSRSGAVDHDGGQGDLEGWISQSLKRLRWLFRSTPAANKEENKGEGVRGSLWFQIERKERRGRLLPHKYR